MAECNISMGFTVKPEDKLCKYSYTAWCPTCDRDSPRRRTKSETTYEPCRRKGKEMKTLTPKKFDRRQEYMENMELDYDLKNNVRFDRIRSNLCELPTSYITNNCQLNSNMSNVIPKLSTNTDFLEYSKFPNDYENSYLIDEYKSAGTIFDNMADKISRNKLEEKHMKSDHHHHHQESRPYTSAVPIKKRSAPIFINNISAYTPTKPQSHSANCQRTLHPAVSSPHATNYDRNFDTCTFFDKQFNPAEVKERYCKELEILREKLRDLRNHKYSPIKPPTVIKNLDKYKDKIITNSHLDDIKVIENVEHPKIDGQKFTEGKSKLNRSTCRLTVKTKAKLTGKQKARSKPVKSSVQLDYDSSEGSDCGSEKECSPNSFQSSDSKEQTENEFIEILPPKTSKPQKGSGDAPNWPLRESLFPYIPPYIKFAMHDSDPNNLPSGKRHMKWKLSTITPIVVRKTLSNTGFQMVRSEFSRESNEWLGTWGKHLKSPLFRTLKSGQKLNHFAGTFQLGRKDRLWKNLQRMMNRYGTKEFGIIPQTYVLPQDMKLLKQNWECKDGSAGEKWIVKPPASARGVGIKVINKWSQLPKQSALVVQRYIADPYLINGSKFDLRLYVLVTSFNPLRIYMYPEGLVRFASVKYSDNDKDLKDRYMHLTNYSINKLSSQYTANEDANACQGHKWTLSKLWEYMDKKGIDTKTLWTNLQKLVIKTMISGESPISQLCVENLNSRYNCYELFGVDVLLDKRLKPWLLEVNISPSLHSTSPLDLHVKGPMVKTLFDLAQFHFPARLGRGANSPPCYNPKLYTTNLTTLESNKHEFYMQMELRHEYLTDILQNLTGDDVRHLTQAEDELVVKGNFERIFPTANTHRYLSFMHPRYYNRLFDAWENKYENNREEGIAILKALCEKKLHLKAAAPNVVSKSTKRKRQHRKRNSNTEHEKGNEFAEYDPWYVESSADGGSPSGSHSGRNQQHED